MSTIGTADIRAFVARRQTAGASNASINRDLTGLKRMFSLAVQASKLVSKPYIASLKKNHRAGERARALRQQGEVGMNFARRGHQPPWEFTG